MDDTQLLELAAKAAGPEFVNLLSHGKWNPLLDDANALRLAVKLRMIVDPDGAIYEVATATPKATGVMAHEKHRADPYAATRRAIVRAAAEIGRAM